MAASPTLGTTAIERDHQVWDYLNDPTDNANLQNRLPAVGETKKVYLVSNTFYTDTDQMTTNDPYTAHKTQWGDGPNIPLFAQLLIKKTDDTVVLSPKALGNISCLWDWEDMTEEIVVDPNPGQPQNIQKYLELTTDYHSDTTKPTGLNCHVDRGGKRGANAKPVFPIQAGIAPAASLANPNDLIFPFNVRAAANRTWAAISTPWRDGDAQAAGKTGVIFQPFADGGRQLQSQCLCQL